MSKRTLSRRQFIKGSAVIAGSAAVIPLSDALASPAALPSASDAVLLGKTGLKISRLGIGTGSNGGQVQRELGQEGFTRLVKEAYDRGVTYIDTADAYRTHELVREATRGLPRERLFIQTKMMWDSPDIPAKPLEVIDRFRKELGTDYIDSLLIHCTTKSTWDSDLKKMMDAFDEAQSRKWVRAKGVSCHGLPALRTATKVDWVQVQLARVNPQGKHVDGAAGKWDEPGNISEAMKEIKAMHAGGRGIIGMKLVGNGDFRNPADRKRAIEFAMTCGCVDSIVIGFKSAAEIDEAMGLMDAALRAKG